MYTPSGLVAAGIILPLLGVFAVCLRFYVRSQFRQSVGIDDWMILAACVPVCGMGGFLVSGRRAFHLNEFVSRGQVVKASFWSFRC